MSGKKPKDNFVRVGNIKTRYWEAGQGDPPVLLVHGLGSFIEHWENNVIPLSKQYRVIALDLVGFGLTDKADVPYTVPYMARFIKDFMATKEIKSASIVGNSLGAAIAIELYLNNPKIVDKLVLLNGGCFERKMALEFRLLTIPFIGRRWMIPNRYGIAKFMKLVFYDKNLITDEMIDLVYERIIQPGSVNAYLKTLHNGADLFGLRQNLVDRTNDNASRITAPTLVIWGSKDKLFPVSHAYKAAKILPNARVHVIENCGHMPQMERAEEFNNLVLGFLKE